jgi:Spy/CpxP family protein refolding chaperone
MKRRIILPLVAGLVVVLGGCGEELLSASPSEAAAQQAPEAGAREHRPGRGMRGMGGEPLARLLEQREALGLTAEQVTRLEALAARMRTTGEALREQMRAQMGEMPERARGGRDQLSDEERAALREQMRARREALRPLMEQTRESQRAAMEEVRSILTDEQEAKLRELRPERPEGMRGPRGGGRVGFPGGRGPRV